MKDYKLYCKIGIVILLVFVGLGVLLLADIITNPLKAKPGVEEQADPTQTVQGVEGWAEELELEGLVGKIERRESEDRSPWIIIDREPGFGRAYPYDSKVLGPVLTVRHYLSELQWRSFNDHAHPQAPVLARFEIIDAYSLDMHNPPDLIGGLENQGTMGFTVRAILYWASLDPTTGIPRGGTQIVRRVEGSHSEGGVYQQGPRVRKVRLEGVDYTVKPNDVSLRKKESVEVLDQAQTGWTIQEPDRVFSSREVDIGVPNRVLPLYDLSAQKLDQKDTHFPYLDLNVRVKRLQP